MHWGYLEESSQTCTLKYTNTQVQMHSVSMDMFSHLSNIVHHCESHFLNFLKMLISSIKDSNTHSRFTRNLNVDIPAELHIIQRNTLRILSDHQTEE